MTDVFISYKREDEARVTPIVEGLQSVGLSVWWDREIAGGSSWRQSIGEQLESARCVIVVWSEMSVGPLGEFVHDEAGRAKARGVLVPVRIDRIAEPLGFGEIQSLDLVDWRGDVRDLRFKNLVTAVQAVVAGGPRPRPMTPGRRARLLAARASGLGVAAAVLGFAMSLVDLQKPLCKIPGVHSLCASWGLGGVPTKTEEALWAQRVPGDCEGLKDYLSKFPEGAFAAEARSRLQAVKTVEAESWIPDEQRLPFHETMTIAPLANEGAARSDALTRAQSEADQYCEGLKIGGLRVKSAVVEPQKEGWHCLPRGSGSVCGFDGHVICHFEKRHVMQQQVCK